MKKHFLTGLAILLPVALTLLIVNVAINMLTAPFVGFVQPVLEHYHLLEKGLLFLSQKQLVQLVAKALVLILLFAITVLLGFVTRWFIVHYFIGMGDAILHRIPVINTVYKTSQEVIKTIFGAQSRSFRQVALVPFPSESMHSVGFVTREDVPGMEEQNMVAVFVPTTPNPTSGFMMFFPRDKVRYLDMSVENAFKYIVSCGVIAAPIQDQLDEHADA